MVGPRAGVVRAALGGELAPGMPAGLSEGPRGWEKGQRLRKHQEVFGLGHQSLSHSRNPVFLKRGPAVVYLYKAEPHLPGRCKGLLHHEARVRVHILTAKPETGTRPREDNVYPRRRHSQI